jgi:hypothetical protein
VTGEEVESVAMHQGTHRCRGIREFVAQHAQPGPLDEAARCIEVHETCGHRKSADAHTLPVDNTKRSIVRCGRAISITQCKDGSAGVQLAEHRVASDLWGTANRRRERRPFRITHVDEVAAAGPTSTACAAIRVFPNTDWQHALWIRCDIDLALVRQRCDVDPTWVCWTNRGISIDAHITACITTSITASIAPDAGIEANVLRGGIGLRRGPVASARFHLASRRRNACEGEQ